MVEVNIVRPMNTEVNMLRIFIKVRDEGSYTLFTGEGGDTVADAVETYVPPFVPGGPGDYIAMDIDINTGQILNWVQPSSRTLEKWIEEHSS